MVHIRLISYSSNVIRNFIINYYTMKHLGEDNSEVI